MTELLAHSPLGASGAARWMRCPGSVSLSDGIQDDESEFASLGTAAHALASNCLLFHADAWERIGQEIGPDGTHYKLGKAPFEGSLTVDKDMADAVQVYLDAVRKLHPDRSQGNTWIERRFHCPDLHEYFYGTSDLTHRDGDTLHVWDYKHGAGIVVEVKENVQLMYYACGMLNDLGLWEAVDTVVLHIAQPRGLHYDGPVRSWSCSVAFLEDWLEKVLLPAMDEALISEETASGEHCRFCPASGRRCPQIMADLDELEYLVQAKKLTPEETGRILDLMVVAMIARKQALKNATGMLNDGKEVPGWKLAKAKSNRKFKDGAQEAAIKKFGTKALTVPALKSPAQFDTMPEGDAFTSRWAFKPDAGLTVVAVGDSRMAVSPNTKSAFTPVTKKRKTK